MKRLTLWIALVALTLPLAACETVLPDAVTTVQPTFTSIYADYLYKCADCHAPGAMGSINGIEQSLDFSTQAKAHATLMTKAKGMSGNPSACNGTAFVVAGNPGKSLLLATLDSSVRQAFDTGDGSGCDVDSITDMTIRVQGGTPSSATLTALHDWIAAGAKND
jgi:hypothetical protein